MADVINETNIVSDENATANVTARIPATSEGIAVAYGSLVIMAVLPIFFGAFRSVRYHKEQKDAGEKTESMSQKDAAMFPVIASIALFGLYIFFQVFSKEYINLLLTGYFFFLGILALTHILSPFINRILGNSLPVKHYHLIFSSGLNEAKEDIVNYKFDNKDLVCLGLCSIFGAWYLWKKHWIANNIFGLAFAINGVELLHLNNIATGCILLGGLFVYDIFWVFGTDVMVTVAKSFEAPIKLVFPQDLLEKGFNASNFAMLGLGDIVIPGIFIALLLRFDVSTNRNRNIYFYSGMIAYLAGLLMTIFVMHVFKHAQPALLYLVPACIGTPLFVALVRGELKVLFQYEDNPADENEQKAEEDEGANPDATDSKKSD